MIRSEGVESRWVEAQMGANGLSSQTQRFSGSRVWKV